MKQPRTKFQPGALRMTFAPPRRRRGRIVSAVMVIVIAALLAIGAAMTTARGHGDAMPMPVITPTADPGVVCIAQSALTICPPSNEHNVTIYITFAARESRP